MQIKLLSLMSISNPSTPSPLLMPPIPTLSVQEPLFWIILPSQILKYTQPSPVWIPSKPQFPDCIGPRILKTCSLALYPVVHHLCKMSLASCKLPKEWKLHCIIPIFKSGDKSLISNYRPISLLCSISKVLERIVYDKVFGFIGQSISKSQ